MEDKVTKKGPLKISISPLMTLLELKKKISKEFDIPIEVQQWKLNGQEANDDKHNLMNFDVKDETAQLHLFIKEKIKNEVKNQIFSNPENSILSVSDSDDGSDSQNEKMDNDSEEGAAGGFPENIPIPAPRRNGWACALCTLINPQSRTGCLACSSLKPNKFPISKLPDELKKFLDNDKVTLPEVKAEKNDLNKQTNNRKSSELFNIPIDEVKSPIFASQALTKTYQIPPQNNIVMTAITSSPNITKNKYRGVDNFKPTSPYIFPTTEQAKPKEEVKKAAPVVKQLILKTSPDKAVPKTNENHYQQLVNLETADVVPNLEEFECTICLMPYQPRKGVVLRDCLHVFL